MVWGTVLTFVCMLRYWMRNVVPRGLQWNCNEVLDVRCTSAEFCSPCGVQQGAAIHAAYTAGVPQSMRYIRRGLRNLYYATIYPFRNIQSSVRYISAQCRIADTEAYRHKLVSFSFPQSLHYIKKAQGCAEGRGLVPLCGFLTFQCDLPSAGPQPMCHTAGGRSLCGIYGRSSAIHTGIRPGPPQPMRLYDRSSAIHAAYTAGIPQSMRPFGRGLRSPCGYYFPIQNLENISLTRSSPSDSPRIRPRLSYASVRSME
mgnify:CR=1 FL=1